MKNLRIILITAGMLVILQTTYSQCQKTTNYQNTKGCQKDLPKEELSQEEISSLKKMREEEMLAYDVYTALSEEYSMPVFRNISGAEERHTNAIKGLIEKYDLEDPAAAHKPGKFQDSQLQEAYNKLMEQGQKFI